MNTHNEIQEKERRVRDLMEREGLDALALSTIPNFAWFTCGGSNYVGIAAEVGVATAVITKNAKYIVCENIEAARILDEEVGGQGFEFIAHKWYEPRRNQIIREIAGGGAIGSDAPMEGAKNAASLVDPCRYSLTSEEIDRYRQLGSYVGESLQQAALDISPGMTEHEIAAIVNHYLLANGAVPIVSLIATDERISKYRHPIPTFKKLDRYAMLVTCARKWGLIISATRIVHFGEAPADLKRKHEATATVDATFIAESRPGADIGGIFRHAVEAYAAAGFADEWQLHHQGGPTGYKGRDFRASAETTARVVENQAFAWNPSITGTKTEDTIIATASGPEIISYSESWPSMEFEIDGIVVKRPDILMR